ncbi:MAG: glycoside hydrolase family 30 protein [Turicibacter sp.]|nr:glycoside hydrolase family 30 protein [Turicibacter sp.]
MKVKHIVSLENKYWRESTINMNVTYEDTLELTQDKRQIIKGFGGCFNEMGWDALEKVSLEVKDNIMHELFDEDKCHFTMGRLPIGASDYALEWYSHDEVAEDYELNYFSIDRDQRYLIPYLREALAIQPNLSLFASPWSPPTWMKTKKAYNFGTLRWEKEVLDAYANYFVKFIEAYQQEGIKIEQIHIQNEPVADQKFPSCIWTGVELRDFIKNHIGPIFKGKEIDTDIWLGTLNGPFIDFMLDNMTPFSEFYDQYVNTVLADKEARQYLSGVGFQWGGKHIIEQVEVSYPELRLMQTENECGDGLNSWEHAEYVYGLFWHYFHHGVESYIYWNIVLPQDGVSTWGWKQNALITIDNEANVTYQPEFYIMKHFSHFIKPGARVIRTTGHWTANSIVFENPDGELVILVASNMNNEREFTFKHEGKTFSTIIEPHSIHTFVIE